MVLAGRGGIHGMIGGQTADILAENSKPEEISNDLLLYIHEHKTASLIQSAMLIGAFLAGVPEELINNVDNSIQKKVFIHL